jgi:hypothetical protein
LRFILISFSIWLHNYHWNSLQLKSTTTTTPKSKSKLQSNRNTFSKLTSECEIWNPWSNCICFELGDGWGEDDQILFSISSKFHWLLLEFYHCYEFQPDLKTRFKIEPVYDFIWVWHSSSCSAIIRWKSDCKVNRKSYLNILPTRRSFRAIMIFEVNGQQKPKCKGNQMRRSECTLSPHDPPHKTNASDIRKWKANPERKAHTRNGHPRFRSSPTESQSHRSDRHAIVNFEAFRNVWQEFPSHITNNVRTRYNKNQWYNCYFKTDNWVRHCVTWTGDVANQNLDAEMKDQQLNMKHCSISGNIPSALGTDSNFSKQLLRQDQQTLHLERSSHCQAVTSHITFHKACCSIKIPHFITNVSFRTSDQFLIRSVPRHRHRCNGLLSDCSIGNRH